MVATFTKLKIFFLYLQNLFNPSHWKQVKEYSNYDKLPLNHTSPLLPGTEESCFLRPIQKPELLKNIPQQQEETPKCSFKNWGKKRRRIAVKFSLFSLCIHHEQSVSPMCGLTFHVFKEITFNTLFELLQGLYAATAHMTHRGRCSSTWILGLTPAYCKCTTQSLEEGHKLGDARYRAKVWKRTFVLLGNSFSVVCFL